MHRTRNRTSSVGLQTGTTLQAKVVRLLLAFQTPATRVVWRGDRKEKVLRPLAVAPRVRLRTSTSRTNLAFPWSITRPPLPVVAGLLGEEDLHAAATTLSLQEALREVLVVAPRADGEQPNVVVGGVGEIGRKYVRSCGSLCPASLTCCGSLQTNRTRESSVAISPQWTMLEEIEFHRLAKLKLDVDDVEDMSVSYHTSSWQLLNCLVRKRHIRTNICV